MSEKRVSAVAISNDGLYVCFADKFGVVYVVDVEELSKQSSTNKKGVPILAHYCSIITRLVCNSTTLIFIFSACPNAYCLVYLSPSPF